MIRYFVRHPTAANLLMLVFILLGVLGLTSLNREVFPEFESDFIHVRVIYKGASALEVEETICQRIEEEIEGTEGIAEVSSTAREGVGIVIVEVADGFDVAEVLKDVENAVDQIDNFPENIEEPLVWEEKQQTPACDLSIFSGRPLYATKDDGAQAEDRDQAAGRMTEKDLVALAEQIKNDLLALDEVSLVETTGFAEHQIRVEVREAALLAYGLSINDVAREIEAQSLDLPAGSVETGQREISIRVLDQRRRAEDFRNLTVKVSPAGARIPLGAVATVRDTFEEDWPRSTMQGRRCINVEVRTTSSEDTIDVVNAVRHYVREKQLPPGVHIQVWGDYSFYVRDRLGMLTKNGIYGFVLVFFTLWAMLNLRLSFWVAVGIPISFLGTLWVMDVTDMSLNMITMFSLIMALGIIVDDAIVIGENIFVHYRRGKSPAEAAVDGTKEVALGVVASMLTTVAVFMPLLMMQGEIGKIMRVMPVGVVTALSVSLIEAFLILPHHLTHSLQRMPKNPPRVRAAIDRFVEWVIGRVYGPVLGWSVRHPTVPIAAVIALFLCSAGLLAGHRLRYRLFPQLDGDFLIAQIEMPHGTDLRRTAAVVRRVEGALGEVNTHFKALQPADEKDLIQVVATSFGFSRDVSHTPVPPESGSHVAQVMVELLSADRRSHRCDDILRQWQETVGEVPDVVSLTFDQLQVTPGGKPIDIQLRGGNLEQLKAASLELQGKIAGYAGVRNLTDNLRPGKEEILVRLKPSARPLGITAKALAAQIRGAFWGSIAEEFQRGSDSFEVEVEFDPRDRRSPADLADFKVRTPSGQTRPLSEVASLRRVRNYSQIVRVDGQRTVSVTADLDTQRANAAQIFHDLNRGFFSQLHRRYPGVQLNMEGQQKESEKTQGSLMRGFLIGLAMIFLLLSFVFQSYVEPLIVMSVIPFGLVGAIWGHMLLGIDWTMPSMIGFISLSGIVVNDSIVLVAFIKLRLREGKSVSEALAAAGRGRFRPVILTSATTVAGLLPLLVETSLQAQFLVPMATSIAFGLLFATVVVLLLVPCLYSILAWLGWTQKIQAQPSAE